jgi:hypothetical protein
MHLQANSYSAEGKNHNSKDKQRQQTVGVDWQKASGVDPCSAAATRQRRRRKTGERSSSGLDTIAGKLHTGRGGGVQLNPRIRAEQRL